MDSANGSATSSTWTAAEVELFQVIDFFCPMEMHLALIMLQRPGFISLWIASVSPTYFDFTPVIRSTSHLYDNTKGLFSGPTLFFC